MASPSVKDGVLDLNLNGSVVEQPARAEWSDLAGGMPKLQQYRLRDLVAALGKARDDDRVKAVALDLDGFTGGGQTAIGDLADAVRSVRAAGKPVVAYAASAIPTTATSSRPRLRGNRAQSARRGADHRPSADRTFITRGCSTSLGVTANVYRVGTYKSAVEPFIRNDMSPEAKQNYLALDEDDARNLAAERQAGAAKAPMTERTAA